jgi:hypothetical protein
VPFTHYSVENFAGKPPKGHTVTQTQAIGINNAEVPTIVGFWADQNGLQFGFEDVKGVFTTILDPNGVSGQNQNLLSVNSAGRAAGFWSDGTNEHGFIVDLGDTPPKFTEIPPKLFNGGVATQASGINDNGQVCGFWNDGAGNSHGFIGPKGGPYKTFNVTINGKMATSTQAFGCSNNFIVGGFLEGGKQHGFKYDGTTFTQIDAPGSKQTAAFGVSGTFINGVNDKGDMVGFFSDGNKVHGYVNFVVSTP